MEGSVPHASSCRGALIWRGLCPWANQQSRGGEGPHNGPTGAPWDCAPNRALPAGFLGPIDPVRARAASDPQDQASDNTLWPISKQHHRYTKLLTPNDTAVLSDRW